MNNAIQYPGAPGERLPEQPASQPQRQKEKILYDEYYLCRYKDDYRLCKDCLERDGGIHAKHHINHPKTC